VYSTQVSRDCLRYHSLCFRDFFGNDENRYCLGLDYTQKDVFGLFHYWLRIGKVHTVDHKRDDVWGLIIRAYKFANMYQIPLSQMASSIFFSVRCWLAGRYVCIPWQISTEIRLKILSSASSSWSIFSRQPKSTYMQINGIFFRQICCKISSSCRASRDKRLAAVRRACSHAQPSPMTV
jgi:hypothetical protein